MHPIRPSLLCVAASMALTACDGIMQPLQRVPWEARAADAAGGSAAVSAGDESVTVAVASIIKQRCTACHSATPTMTMSAPAGILFDTSDQIVAKKDRIKVRTVELETMPPLNRTKMTDAERTVIRRWLETLSK